MKFLSLLFATALMLSTVAVYAQETDADVYDDLRETTIAPLFDALKAGDLAGIKRHLRADFYEQYRVLFEQNTEYGKFLSDYYAGSTYDLVNIRKAPEGYNAEVVVYWPDGRNIVMNVQVVEGEGQQRRVVFDD